MLTRLILSVLLTVTFIDAASAQYFGRNKPRYRSFDFDVVQTPNFEIYYYLKNKEQVDRFANLSEYWYERHKAVFGDSIVFLNPLILYNNHADFQQTNQIGGSVGPGTGGVTEAFRNRVVMPLAFTHQQTHHVLGHELVHAFQFNSILNSSDSTSLRSLSNYPLWMPEGLAEYLSLGSEDSHTAMWMRDAVNQDDIPTIEEMGGYKYFPYRYGHAMWSVIAGVYGEDKLGPLYQLTGKYGMQAAMDSVLNTSPENLSNMYEGALKTYYEPLLAGRNDKPAKAKVLLDGDNSGNMNISPSISPNGKYVIYLSEKNLISTDLFLANARSGEVMGKFASLTSGGADHFNYIESSGTWSPDSEKFAYVVFKKGRNAIVVRDVESKKVDDEYSFKEVSAIMNPAWSPDGRSILFSGLHEGQVDLYKVNVRNGKLTQVTDDPYSEILAQYNADGSKIVFSTDKRSYLGDTYDGMYTLDLAEMDTESGTINYLPIFPGADNLNPVYDQNGNILFLSDPDGFRDLYKYHVKDGTVSRLTHLKTGVSGITRYSPALSAARKLDRIVFSVYADSKYTIYRGKVENMLAEQVDPQKVDKVGAILPVVLPENKRIVDAGLKSIEGQRFEGSEGFVDADYRPQFKLDYIGGGGGIGVSTNNFSTNAGLQGGIQTLFSDILGNNQLSALASLNGDILDFGTQATYINRSNRLAYGIGINHVPQRTGYQSYADDKLKLRDGSEIDVVRRDLNIIRVFNEGLSGFVHFPFSTTLRAEAGINGFYQHFRQDLTKDYFQVDQAGNVFQVYQEKEKVKTGDNIRFNQYYNISRGFGGSMNVALVGDNSYFGMTAPIAGHRFRLSAEYQMGIDNFTALLADGRKYFYAKPFTFAVRGLAYNRFEKTTNTVYPFFVGSMGFVRGYGDIYSDARINPEINIDRMIGSKIAMVSAEVRFPFTGPKQLALIGSNFFLSDLFLFMDGGVSFDDYSQFTDGRPTSVIKTDGSGNIVYGSNGLPVYVTQNEKPLLATSIGAGIRVNLGGAIILEPHFARQLVNGGRWDFGFNLIPGW